MLSIAQEELEIKKKLITRMEEVDKGNSNKMGSLMTNMKKLIGSIVEGFAMLIQIMLSPPQPPMHPHYQPHQYYPKVMWHRSESLVATTDNFLIHRLYTPKMINFRFTEPKI